MFALIEGVNLALGVDDREAGAGRSLIDRADELRHDGGSSPMDEMRTWPGSGLALRGDRMR
jgi:hypothetical protein